MAKPAANFPISALPSYQEIQTVLDTLGAFTQQAVVALTSAYAAGATAINIAVTGTPFTTWPIYGFIDNQTTGERMFYSNILTNNTLVIAANGRGLSGTPTTIGAIGQNINFVEARICGLIINQILSEITALENIRIQNDITASPRAILNTESFQTFSNVGAGSSMTMNLPAAVKNLRYRFYVDNANGIVITANGTDTINEGDISSGAGGTCTGIQAFSFVEIQCTKTGVWVVTSKSGAFAIA